MKEEKLVDEFLFLYELPLDILLEVKDHMISQINDFQLKDKLSFEKAFFQTKIKWEEEFKMTKFSLFYPEEIPVIVKKIVKARYIELIKKSLFYGMISLVINFIFIYLSKNQEVYSTIFKVYNSLFVVFPICIWIFNSQTRKYVKRDFKYQNKLFYTIYQRNFVLFGVCANLMVQILLRENGYAFQFIRTENSGSIFMMSIALIIPLMMQIMMIFVMLNFAAHYKSIHKMRAFLNPSV